MLSNLGLFYSLSDLVKMSELSKINSFLFLEEVLNAMNEIKYNLLQEIMNKNEKKKKAVANNL